MYIYVYFSYVCFPLGFQNTKYNSQMPITPFTQSLKNIKI